MRDELGELERKVALARAREEALVKRMMNEDAMCAQVQKEREERTFE